MSSIAFILFQRKYLDLDCWRRCVCLCVFPGILPSLLVWYELYHYSGIYDLLVCIWRVCPLWVCVCVYVCVRACPDQSCIWADLTGLGLEHQDTVSQSSKTRQTEWRADRQTSPRSYKTFLVLQLAQIEGFIVSDELSGKWFLRQQAGWYLFVLASGATV